MQMLTVDLKYKTGRLNLEDSMVLAYAVVVYVVMAYITVAYTMMSFIQIQSMWRQHSESEDLIAFFSPLFAVPVNLLYPPHFQIFHGVARLAEVGRDWLFRLPRPDVKPVSIHPGMQGILRLSDTLQTTLFA